MQSWLLAQRGVGTHTRCALHEASMNSPPFAAQSASVAHSAAWLLVRVEQAPMQLATKATHAS
jgi:hypothetical protein